jgi:hypothetical protein
MRNAVAGRTRRTKIYHASIPVELPEDATAEEKDALVARALYQAYSVRARRSGVDPLPAQVGRPHVPPVVSDPLGPSSYPPEEAVWEILERINQPGPPSPYVARTISEFLDRMRELKKWSGLSFEALEQRANDVGRKLPHSTTARWLAKGNDSRLPDDIQLTAFVLACGLSKDQWKEWVLVWGDVQITSRSAGQGYLPALLDRLWRRRGGVGSLDEFTSVETKGGTLVKVTPRTATWLLTARDEDGFAVDPTARG